MDEKIIKKFWASIEKTDTCWNWTKSLDKKNLPIMKCMGISFSARKVSLSIIGKETNNSKIQTICNNKLCVNPDHLICGTPDRFWNKVQKLPEEQGGCWIWIGCLNNKMYGQFTIVENGIKKDIRAHIYSWQLYTDRRVPTESGVVICHKCDHPYCVNPHHLFLGTQEDNMKDMAAKGRNTRFIGSSNGRSKLTEKQVKEIRISYPAIGAKELSQKYNITLTSIYAILNNKTWKHIE